MKLFWRLLPLLIIVVVVILIYSMGITDLLSYDELKRNRQILLSWVEAHSWTAPLAYIGIYVIAVALSLPVGAIFAIVGGFLFGQPGSTAFALIGATLGAICIFLAARTAFGATLRARAGPRLKKMEKGFNENAASYLLFLRLTPLVPFWLVNIAPAFFSVKLFTFVWTTFVGTLPRAFVFTQAGVGLGAILDKGEAFSITTVFNIQVQIALFALALFALIPLIVKLLRKKRPH